jgi:hypothetical protein
MSNTVSGLARYSVGYILCYNEVYTVTIDVVIQNAELEVVEAQTHLDELEEMEVLTQRAIFNTNARLINSQKRLEELKEIRHNINYARFMGWIGGI